MAAKRMWFAVVALTLTLSPGCCKWCEHWCGNQQPAGAQCQCVPCCAPQPCCPPGTAPVPAVPAQNWQRPVYSGQPGCCP
jgi:hypothetical protein